MKKEENLNQKHNIFILKEDKIELGILENPKINNIF